MRGGGGGGVQKNEFLTTQEHNRGTGRRERANKTKTKNVLRPDVHRLVQSKTIGVQRVGRLTRAPRTYTHTHARVRACAHRTGAKNGTKCKK